MAFTPKTAPYNGKINAVTLGTGDKAIVIGGQNVLPFYTFDASIENAPKIGAEISDAPEKWTTSGLLDFYAGCTTMAERAAKAATMEGVDFICLNFESADPNGKNRPTAECVADAVAVAEILTIANASKLQSSLEEMSNYWGPVENFGDKVVTGDITMDTVETAVDEMMEALNP